MEGNRGQKSSKQLINLIMSANTVCVLRHSLYVCVCLVHINKHNLTVKTANFMDCDIKMMFAFVQTLYTYI